MEKRPANDAAEPCNSCEGGREGMEVKVVAISGSVHVSTGAAVAEERVGEKVKRQPANDAAEPCNSCEGGREGIQVKTVAISGSVHVSTATVEVKYE